MALTFDPTYPFLALLLVYMVYSEWARLDSRCLVGAALLLLVVTAVVDAAGQTADANVLSEYVFFLLAGGVVLLLVDHVREERARAQRAEKDGPERGKESSPPDEKTTTEDTTGPAEGTDKAGEDGEKAPRGDSETSGGELDGTRVGSEGLPG
ncbi:MAG: hypothetical protein KGI89_11830 [Euryarchaeota archaeon]|nr:hypothetical protein [Euryarchaeota archaeon]